MFNQIDCILLTIIVFILCYILTALLNLPIWLCIIFALSAAMLCGLAGLYLNTKKQRYIDYNGFVNKLITSGQESMQQLVLENFPNNFSLSDDYVIFKQKPTFFWLKFSNISLDSLLEFYKKCVKSGYNSAIIFSKSKDRKYYQFSHYFDDFVFEFESYKSIYNKLKGKMQLPTGKNKKTQHMSQTLSLIFKSAFCRKNCKHFLLASFFILLMSFITPLSVYYLVMAAITTTFAAICLFVK